MLLNSIERKESELAGLGEGGAGANAIEVDAEGGDGDVEMKDAADAGASGSGDEASASASGVTAKVMSRAKALEVITQIADLECDVVKRVAKFIVHKVRPAESTITPAMLKNLAKTHGTAKPIGDGANGTIKGATADANGKGAQLVKDAKGNWKQINKATEGTNGNGD